MKITKREHRAYTEWKNAKKKEIHFRQLVGKYQYIYTSRKGIISLIKFLNYFEKGDNFYEIRSLKGNLFEDVERFKTKKEAVKRIEKLLESFFQRLLNKIKKYIK